MRLVPFLVTTSVVALLSACDARAADGDITSVLLSSGGLAEVIRSFEADGPARISLSVPPEQVDDVLKSVIVADPAGTVSGVTLEGADSVNEAFRTLPFGPEDLVSPDRVAAAMRGFEAVVDDGEGNEATGVILGVTSVQRPSEGGAIAVPAVALQGADGSVRQVLLGPSASISFVDQTIAERITAAGRGLQGAKAGGAKTVLVSTEGTGKRRVTISHVAAAPVWKVAYRVIAADDSKARIQGWAVLENATGEDWKGVSVTLSSSNPVALSQRLYAMYWRSRPEAPIALPGGPVGVSVDDGALYTKNREDEAGLGLRNSVVPSSDASEGPAMAEIASGLADGLPLEGGKLGRYREQPSAPTQAALAVEGDVGIRFTIPGKVDLPSGHTLSVPIVDADYDAELVSLWRPDGGSRHPVAALFVSNGAEGSLPPGIFTVFDQEGYLGDAQILGIPPGETRYAAFAADPKVSVDAETGDTNAIASVKAVKGVVTVARRVERVTTYLVKGAVKAARAIMIDHPRQIGWIATSESKIESETSSELRLRAELQPNRDATIKVTESTINSEEVYLLNSDEATLLAWSSQSGLDEQTAASFARLAALRRGLSTAESYVNTLQEKIDRLEEEQGRVRSNLSVVPETSELAKSYLEAMAKHDRDITAVNEERTAAETTLHRLQGEYQDAVLNF